MCSRACVEDRISAIEQLKRKKESGIFVLIYLQSPPGSIVIISGGWEKVMVIGPMSLDCGAALHDEMA